MMLKSVRFSLKINKRKMVKKKILQMNKTLLVIDERLNYFIKHQNYFLTIRTLEMSKKF